MDFLIHDLTKPLSMVEFAEVIIFFFNGNIYYVLVLLTIVLMNIYHEAHESEEAHHHLKDFYDFKTNLIVMRV